MTDLSAIQGWVSEIDSTMAGLPAALSAAAPSGDFGAVLASALAVLNGEPAGGPAGEVASQTGTSQTGASQTGASAPTSPAPAGTTVPSSLPSTGAATAGVASDTLDTSDASDASGISGSDVVAEAEQFLGVPYVWGGSTPAGFDCSGLVQYVYGQLGVSLPRTSEEQALVGTAVPDLADAEPGDLVFFPGSDGTPSAPGHVGIYLGNGEMIDAPYSGTDVQVQSVGDPVAIRRVLGSTAAVGSLASAADAIGNAVTGVASTAASTPSSLTPLFLAAAKTYGVPADVLEAVAKEESDFSPGAVSSAGAQGLMQLMPQTASSLGVDSFDPSQAIDGAASLLSGYLKQFGSLSDALAAYNAGPAAVERSGGVPPDAQTQAYVQGVLDDIGADGVAASTAASAATSGAVTAATAPPSTAATATSTASTTTSTTGSQQ